VGWGSFRSYHEPMRLRPIPSETAKPRRRRRRRLVTIQVVPTLITAGNLIMGVLAVAYLVDAAATPVRAEALFVRAAWLIFFGMFLDTLDGRIARMTGTTSDFGAQLDSLADVVTFGVAPALLAKSLLAAAFPALSGKLIFSLCLVYVLGAALRLARYNVESERTSSAGAVHVTRVFRGLPSPAAAGVIASMVLLRHEFAVHQSVDWAVLFFTPLLGMLMVSRMPYSHLMNRYFDAGRAQPLIVVVLALLVYLVVAHFIETVSGIFLLYAFSGPVLTLSNRLIGWPAWVVHEEEDEEELPPDRTPLGDFTGREDDPQDDPQRRPEESGPADGDLDGANPEERGTGTGTPR